jgi:hypothetical protein
MYTVDPHNLIAYTDSPPSPEAAQSCCSAAARRSTARRTEAAAHAPPMTSSPRPAAKANDNESWFLLSPAGLEGKVSLGGRRLWPVVHGEIGGPLCYILYISKLSWISKQVVLDLSSAYQKSN